MGTGGMPSLADSIDASAGLFHLRPLLVQAGQGSNIVHRLALGRRLDDSLFRLAEDKSRDAVQEALIAVGALAIATGQRPKLRESLPPPRLSSERAQAAGRDDGSHEFAIAAALASLDEAAACVLRLSCTSTVFSAEAKWVSLTSLRTCAKSTAVRRSVTWVNRWG